MSVSRSTARRAQRSPFATPKCSSTASCGTRPLRAAAGDRPLHPRRRRPGDVRAGVHDPRVPIRRGDRLAGRRLIRTRSAPSSATPTWHGPAGSNARTTLLTKFHDNVVWSMRGNFVDVPTDCPQRDERLGWTGDLQVFAPDGVLPVRLPGVHRRRGSPTSPPSRLNTAPVPPYVPWVRARCFHRSRLPRGATPRSSCRGCCTSASATHDVLATSTRSMRTWVDEIADPGAATIICGTQVSSSATGSTLLPRPTGPPTPETDPYLIATAYHARTAALRRARGRGCSASPTTPPTLRELADAVAAAFNREYVTPLGAWPAIRRPRTRWRSRSTSSRRRPARRARRAARRTRRARRLPHRDWIRRHPPGLRRTRRHGYLDEAYHLLTQDECPSWLYPVTMGATTIWERWDSMLPGRLDQPWRDDVVQPLRARAPSPTSCIGSSPGSPPSSPVIGNRARRPATRRRTHVGLRHDRHDVRRRIGRMAAQRRRSRGRRHHSRRRDRNRRHRRVPTTQLGPGAHHLIGTCRAVEDDPRASRTPHAIRRDRIRHRVTDRVRRHIGRRRLRRHR